MTKKQSSLSKQQPAALPATDDCPFGQVFLIKKDGTMTPEPGIPEGQEPLLAMLSTEEMDKLVTTNRAVLFGERTIGLTAQIGDFKFNWDAFLFDFSNREDPRCYLLRFAKGVTQSMLSMIVLNNILEAPEHRTPLIQALITHIQKDKTKLKIFKPFIVEGYTLENMLEYVIRRNLRALFLVNEDDPDCARLYSSYAETRSATLDVMFLRKYKVGKHNMLSVFPEFSETRKKQEFKAPEPKPKKEKVVHTEEFHLSKSTVAAALYEKLKAATIKIDKSVIFNPKGKHYIAMKKPGGKNLAFFHLRKSMYLVVKLDEKIVRKMVKKNSIQSLPASVQKFWNGPSTGLVISSTDHLKEIVEVLKKLIKQ